MKFKQQNDVKLSEEQNPFFYNCIQLLHDVIKHFDSKLIPLRKEHLDFLDKRVAVNDSIENQIKFIVAEKWVRSSCNATFNDIQECFYEDLKKDELLKKLLKDLFLDLQKVSQF